MCHDVFPLPKVPDDFCALNMCCFQGPLKGPSSSWEGPEGIGGGMSLRAIGFEGSRWIHSVGQSGHLRGCFAASPADVL